MAGFASRPCFTDSIVKSANAPPPLFLAARGTPYSKSAAPGKAPRARGTPRVQDALKFTQSAQTESARTHGPRRLATSRLVEVRISSASPPNPRRPARGVYRFAPHGPRWTDRFRRPFSRFRLSGALIYRYEPKPARPPVTGSRRRSPLGPRDARLARQDHAAWTAGPARRISDAQSFPGHRSPPYVRDADQTPLGNEGGMTGI